MADFIESNFLQEQVEAIKELAGHITNLDRVGNGLGVYQFDKLTLGGGDQKFIIEEILETVQLTLK